MHSTAGVKSGLHQVILLAFFPRLGLRDGVRPPDPFKHLSTYWGAIATLQPTYCLYSWNFSRRAADSTLYFTINSFSAPLTVISEEP